MVSLIHREFTISSLTTICHNSNNLPLTPPWISILVDFYPKIWGSQDKPKHNNSADHRKPYTQDFCCLKPCILCHHSNNLPLTPQGFHHSWNFTIDLKISSRSQDRPKHGNTIGDLPRRAIYLEHKFPRVFSTYEARTRTWDMDTTWHGHDKSLKNRARRHGDITICIFMHVSMYNIH